MRRAGLRKRLIQLSSSLWLGSAKETEQPGGAPSAERVLQSWRLKEGPIGRETALDITAPPVASLLSASRVVGKKQSRSGNAGAAAN